MAGYERYLTSKNTRLGGRIGCAKEGEAKTLPRYRLSKYDR